MKKRLAYILFASLFSLFGCKERIDQDNVHSEKKEQTTGWKEYKSDSMHFSIACPPGWEARLNGNKIGLFERKKDSTDVFEDNIIIWVEEMPVAIPDSLYAVASVTEFKIKNPGIEPRVLPVHQAGSNAFHSFTFDFENKKKELFSIIGYTTVEGNRGYNFTCTSLKNELNIHQGVIDSILTTFKPL